MSIITVKYVIVIFLVFWDCCTLLKGRHLTNVMALDDTNEYGFFCLFCRIEKQYSDSRTPRKHFRVAYGPSALSGGCHIGRPPVRTLSRKPSIGSRFATRKLSLTTIRRIRRMYSEEPVYNNITRRAILTLVPL